MRPCKLVFNGINSFSERTEIDFDKLTASGLFGIFGETGSGKSTILDCINFALYGNVDRSKKKTDIINYNCEQAEVEFEFTLLSDGVRKKYRVERSIKKKSGLGKAMLYVYEGDSSQCIADNTTSVNAAIEETIGLNADDFRKCIALPQGEFAQFVQCAPAERFKIIERLFSLSRYGEGLKDRLAKRESEIEARYSTLSGELIPYADVTEEAVANSKRKFEQESSALSELEKLGGEIKSAAERLNGVYKSKIELDNAEKEFSSLVSKAEERENLRKVIKSAPSCKRVSLLDKELGEKRKEYEEERLIAKKLQDDFAALSLRYDKRIEEFSKSGYEEKIEQLKGKIAAFEAAQSDISELSETDKSLNSLRTKFKTAVANGDRLREEERSALKAAELSKKALENCADEDLADLLEAKLKPAVLRGEYSEQLVYFGDLRESIKGYDNDSDLYKFLREELTDRIKYYESKILAVHNSKINVDEVIEGYKKKSALREKLQKEYDEKREQLASCRQALAVSENEKSTLQREGEEVKLRYIKLKEKLDKLFGESEEGYQAAERRIREKCKELISERDKVSSEIENGKKRLDEIHLATEKTEVKCANLCDSVKQYEKQVAAAIEESGYTSVEECANVLRVLEGYKDAERELLAYDERVAALKAKIAELKAVEGINDIDLERVERANQRLKDWETSIKDKHAQVKLSESEFRRLSEILSIKNAKEASLKEIEKKRETVFQLKELTRGNKFLEYIAGEYLSDISKSASVTLLKLTGGRYYLVYDDSFYVGDNYNEGKKRGVNTLSGGETFLVSLSLALALSSAICRGSLRSIEFFFLDEGFGTLDESLVDTVMDTLEKLRSADFTVGIISHVEELKHRIESKIVVNKATETHGSSVSVCA